MGLEEYGLGFFHCEECDDKGLITRQDESGVLYSRECSCMNRRRALRQLKESGLDGIMSRYSFSRYLTPDRKAEELKRAAEKYCDSPPAWFYISGRPGSGKTHLCTAICGSFIRNGKAVFYCVWPEVVGKIKAMKTEDPVPPEYEKTMELLKTIAVLYIDDLFKGKATEADYKIAFEILNARYNNPKLRTIISSELNLDRIKDDAIRGRITERAREYVLTAPGRDWRQTA